MKIQPLGNIIQLDLEEAKAGDLVTSSRDSAVEYAKVIAVGTGDGKILLNSYVFVKAWAIDIITHQDKRYFFVNLDTQGVLAVVK